MYISIGALIAVAWMAYCFFPALDEFFPSDRRELKEIDRKSKKIKKAHHYDEKYQCQIRTADGAVMCQDTDGDPYYMYRNDRGLAVIPAPHRLNG
jgi:hypothetical protein